MHDFLWEQFSADRNAVYDKLIGALIGLARATEGNDHMLSSTTAMATMDALRAICSGTTDEAVLSALMSRVTEEKRKLVPSCFLCACPCGRTEDYNMANFYAADEKIRSLRSSLLSHVCAIGATSQNPDDEAVCKFLYLGLYAIGMDDWGKEELLPILKEAESIQ